MEKGRDLESMTREELIGLVRSLLAVAAEVHELRAEVKDLKGKLALNSSNSSKPPSSDFAKPRPADPRKAGEHKAGGQKGHPGATLRQVEACRVDLVVEHGPLESKCSSCGKFLPKAVDAGLPRRQVLDLPAMAFLAAEHFVLASTCACGMVHQGSFPAGVEAPVQYGPRMRAAAAILGAGPMVPGPWCRSPGRRSSLETSRGCRSRQASRPRP